MPKKKKNYFEVEIPHSVSPTTFVRILEFIYCGEVDVSKFSENELVQISFACTLFEGLQRLQWLCEDQIQKMINVSNIYEILKWSDQYKLAYLKDYTIHFAGKKYKLINIIYVF